MMSFQPRLAPVLAGPETKDDSNSIRQKAEGTNGFRSRLLSAMKCLNGRKERRKRNTDSGSARASTPRLFGPKIRSGPGTNYVSCDARRVAPSCLIDYPRNQSSLHIMSRPGHT